MKTKSIIRKVMMITTFSILFVLYCVNSSAEETILYSPDPGLHIKILGLKQVSRARVLLELETDAVEIVDFVNYEIDIQKGFFDETDSFKSAVIGGSQMTDEFMLKLRSNIKPGIYLGSILAWSENLRGETSNNLSGTTSFGVLVYDSGRMELLSAEDAIELLQEMDPVPKSAPIPEDAFIVNPEAKESLVEQEVVNVDEENKVISEDERQNLDGSYTFRVSGTLNVLCWDNKARPLRGCYVYIYDYDPEDYDDLLGSVMTDSNGKFSITITSDEADGPDLYYQYWLQNNSWRVSNLKGDVYWWPTGVVWNIKSDYEFPALGPVTNKPAAWIFNTMYDAWYNANSLGHDPGYMQAQWPGDGTGSHYELGPNLIHIHSNNAFEPSTYSPDVIVHEWAHAHMDNAFQHNWPPNAVVNPHYINKKSNVECAWTEGWADFYPLTVYKDGCFDFNWQLTNRTPLEWIRDMTNGWDSGNDVEGRVAAALLDLWDSDNDELDWNVNSEVSLLTLMNTLRIGAPNTWAAYYQNLRNYLTPNQLTCGFWDIVQNTIYCAPESNTMDWGEPQNNSWTTCIPIWENNNVYWTNCTINPAGDVDWFKFYAISGRSYTIETYAHRYCSYYIDTFLSVYKKKVGFMGKDYLVIVGYNDNLSSSTYDSRYTFTPDTSGYYYIKVTNNWNYGNSYIVYSLSIKNP